MSEIEGGAGSLPPFQPQPGGFGRRQVPLDNTVADDRATAMPSAPAAANAASASPLRDKPANSEPMATSAIAAPRAGTAEPKRFTTPIANSATSQSIPQIPGQIADWLTAELRDGRDLHCETLLTVIGALAGFAAQQGIWEAEVKPGKMAIQQAFNVIETRSGEVYFFGDHLNDMLVGKTPDAVSIWKIVADGARALGAVELPEVKPIIKNCAETVGTSQFGLPRLPDGHLPKILPHEAVVRYWAKARRMLDAGSDPMNWAFDLAAAARYVMVAQQDHIDPALAAQAVMEAAVPMSKIDPLTVPRE